jgi:hypothetical protein
MMKLRGGAQEMVCSHCGEQKPIYRFLVLKGRDGQPLDAAQYCRECWTEYRQAARARGEGAWQWKPQW